MSFSDDVRSTRNFQRQFQKEKRRIAISEIDRDDIDNLQTTVNLISTYVHHADCPNTTENIEGIPLGPHDYIFEPDYNTVKIRTLFRDVNGNGSGVFVTLNGIDYFSLQLFDQANSGSVLNYSIRSNDGTGLLREATTFDRFWKWNVGFHPPNLEHGNSLSLNVGTDTLQMFNVTSPGSNFNFSSTPFSIGFWIYLTDLTTGSNKRVVAYRSLDANNQWSIEIDASDNKLFAIVKNGGSETKRQYDTPLVVDTWYFVALTWNNTGSALVLKVNDNADTSSTKTTGTIGVNNALTFGSYAGASSGHDMKGYLTGITYYNNTVLSSTELTRVYNYNTKSDTTKPMTYGYGQYG